MLLHPISMKRSRGSKVAIAAMLLLALLALLAWIALVQVRRSEELAAARSCSQRLRSVAAEERLIAEELSGNFAKTVGRVRLDLNEDDLAFTDLINRRQVRVIDRVREIQKDLTVHRDSGKKFEEVLKSMDQAKVIGRLEGIGQNILLNRTYNAEHQLRSCAEQLEEWANQLDELPAKVGK